MFFCVLTSGQTGLSDTRFGRLNMSVVKTGNSSCKSWREITPYVSMAVCNISQKVKRARGLCSAVIFACRQRSLRRMSSGGAVCDGVFSISPTISSLVSRISRQSWFSLNESLYIKSSPGCRSITKFICICQTYSKRIL